MNIRIKALVWLVCIAASWGIVIGIVFLACGCNITLPKIPPATTLPEVVTNIMTATTQPETNTNQYVITRWHGPDGSNAKEVKVGIKSVSIRKGKMRLSHDPIQWGDYTLIHIGVDRGNGWEVYKFDWIRGKGQPIKLTENITDGYKDLKNVLPMKEGEPVLIVFSHIRSKSATSCDLRSEFFLTEWHE